MKSRARKVGKYLVLAFMVFAFIVYATLYTGRRSSRPPKQTDNVDTQQTTHTAPALDATDDSYTYVYAEDGGSPVKNFRARAGDAVIFLEWDSVAELDGNAVDGYVVYRYSETSGGFAASAGTAETNKTIYYLTNNAEYRFKVAARYIINGQEVLSALTEEIVLTPRYSAKIRLSSDFLLLKTGESDRIIAKRYGDEIPLTWTSSDETVATIDENGLVIAVGSGQCEVSGTYGASAFPVAVVVDRAPSWIEGGISPRYIFDEESGWYVPVIGTETEEDGPITLAFVGDLMSTYKQQDAVKDEGGMFDFTKSFQYVSELLGAADFAMGNLETAMSYSFPYASDLHNYMGAENCNSPSEFAYALKQAGFDAVATANNQSGDAGPVGIVETLDALDYYKLIATGTFRDDAEQRYVLVNIKGIKCGIISVTQKPFNLQEALFSSEQLLIMTNQAFRSNMTRDIADAKVDGAEFIIVYNHGGHGGLVGQTSVQSGWIEFLAEAGADLILNAHPHLLQTIGHIVTTDGREVVVAYSLGNFLSSMTNFDNACTIILNVILERENGAIKISDVSYTPCYLVESVVRDKYVVVPAIPEYEHLLGDILRDKVKEYIRKILDKND